MIRNIRLYPWFKFIQLLSFWQATWFLYFEKHLSASEAILLYVVYDISTTVLEVPSGYMSDRLGRRLTLTAAAFSGLAAGILLIFGENFAHFVMGNVLLGAAAAFSSGTDSSLIYESLRAEGRDKEIEATELKAWRFGFSALALSALTGGVMALYDDVYPYIATALSAAGLLALTLFFREPPHAPRADERENLRILIQNLKHPTLLWLLCLSLVMYVFSHVPYVLGQPFIREALTLAGYGQETPLVSGGVTFTMMVLSVAVSLVALPIRNRLGLPSTLLLAFSMQIALIAALATSNNLFVIALLFLRMIPDSLSLPFIRARIQPLLEDGTRATYLSVQSLAGRILFAVTLSWAASRTSGEAALPYADMQIILAVYAVCGVALLLALALTAKRARV